MLLNEAMEEKFLFLVANQPALTGGELQLYRVWRIERWHSS